MTILFSPTSFALLLVIVNMSEPELGVNLTQVPSDILLRLVDATEEIRDLLRQKAGQENGTAQQTNGASPQGEDPPEVADTTADQPANVETDDSDNWPNDSKIAEYKNRCTKHKSECEKMQVELGCLIAHLGIVGGDKYVIKKAESLRKGLLDPVQCLEKALNAPDDGRPDAMKEVKWSFNGLDDFVRDVAHSPHQKDALYPNEVEQWRNFTLNGWDKIDDLVDDGKFVECLEFIHDVLFSDLETAMGGVVEALATFEEQSAIEWLATQKAGYFDERIRHIFSATESDGSISAWPSPVEIVQFKERSISHKLSYNEMREELGHLIAHYGVIGGDKEVVKEAKVLQRNILAPLDCLERALTLSPNERPEAMIDVVVSFNDVYIYASNFQKSLYHQKHAFYFRKVKKWVSCLWNGMLNIISLLRESKVAECLRYICNDFFSNLEEAMNGVSKASEKMSAPGAKADVGSVAVELTTFGKESLPKFLVDQMERDTTRYVNLTTIATFFSSVTATTLQFTYAETDSVPSNALRGVVNLFWFLSLVFSVSSGVSSLLGLTWRKSSIYDPRIPPMLIRMWLDKAPMLFLVVAAVTFVIGLNLFAHLSLQPRYVSLATNILSGLHGVCLVVATAWFIYKVKQESILEITEWIETGMKRIWIKAGGRWIWKMVKRPYKKYKRNLHLQRNIFWAFGIDNRVARLNFDIDWRYVSRDYPGPYLLSKLIRCIAYPIKRCWLGTKKALSDLSRTVRAHICVPSRTGRTGDDVEMGETVRRQVAEAHDEILLESPAKSEFRKSLQMVFNEAERVDRIMISFDVWEDEIMDNHPIVKHIFRAWLWGYPDLVQKLFEVVLPALFEERETKRREKEEVEQQDMTDDHAGHHNAYFAPESGGLLVDDNAAVTPTPALLDDGTRATALIQTDAQPDSQDQAHPSTSDERAPLTTSATTEVLEPTSEDLIPQPDIGEGVTLPLEIEDVPSTSENSH